MSIEYFVEGKVTLQSKGEITIQSKENIVNNAGISVEQKGKETGVSYGKAKEINSNDKPVNTIEVSLNLFFDGTQNNKTNTQAGKDYKESNHKDDSYTNDFSNVARGFDATDPNAENQTSWYIEGIGTEDLESESTFFGNLPNNAGIPFGMGDRGVEAKVTKGCIKGAEALNKYKGQKGIHLKVNVYGFSRGATAARHFLHIATSTAIMSYTQGGQKIKVFPPYDSGRAEETFLFTDKDGTLHTFLLQYGYFGACLIHSGVFPKKITFNFVGLYDTVASFGLVHSNDTTDLGLDAVKKAYFTLQLAADDEYRDNFDLTNINSTGVKGLTFTLPGVHSDVGGCYVNNDTEIVNIFYENSNMKECERFKKILEEEGWYSKEQLDIVHSHNTDFSSPEFRIPGKMNVGYFGLVGTRKLFNSYDKIPLNTMFHYSKQLGVKYLDSMILFNKINDPFLVDIYNQLASYMTACNTLRSSYLEEYNKSNSSGDYVKKLESINYLDYINLKDLKKLRNKYLHWSASATKTGLGPRVGIVTDAKNRKRNIQNG